MKSDVAVAHVAFDFGFGDEGGDRVDDHHIHTAGAHKRIADFQSLFAGIGLGKVELFYFDTELARVNGIEGMFRINKGTHAAVFLTLCDRLKAEGGFTGRLRTEDFDDTAARQAADTECQVQTQ